MVGDGPSEDAVPQTVIVGHFQSPSAASAPLAKNPVQSAEATDSGHGRHEPWGIMGMPNPLILVENRLKIASFVFTASMFFGWRLDYWGDGYYGFFEDGSRQFRFGLFELFDFISYTVLGPGWFERQAELAEFIGWLPAMFFALRDLMFIVLTVAFVYCWVRKQHLPRFSEKLGVFLTGYFCFVTVGLLVSTLMMQGEERAFYAYITETRGSVFASIGFWLAGFSGILIHPKWIPVSDNLMSGIKTTLDDDGLPLSGAAVAASGTKTDDGLNPTVLFLYHVPLVYLFMVILSVSDGGDDNALFMGITAPIVGFVVGLVQLRWEFLKGFLLQLGVCFPLAVVLFILSGGVGAFGDVGGLDEIFFIALLPTLFLPFRYYMNGMKYRALGATYAAPLGFFILVIGIMFGVIMRYGLF